MSLFASLNPTSLAGANHWVFLLWISTILFFSPVLFVLCVTLPELPVRMARRIFYSPFDSIRWRAEFYDVIKLTKTDNDRGSGVTYWWTHQAREEWSLLNHKEILALKQFFAQNLLNYFIDVSNMFKCSKDFLYCEKNNFDKKFKF